jgi:hypothetical protein
MTPCIGPYSPVAAISEVRRERFHPTDHVPRRGSIQRSRPPLELRTAVSRQADGIFTGICRRWYALWYAEALILRVGRPSVLCGDWPWSR